MRWSRSARLTAVAATSRTTSSGPGTGSGTSAMVRASGPPGSVTTTARMRASLEARRVGRQSASISSGSSSASLKSSAEISSPPNFSASASARPASSSTTSGLPPRRAAAYPRRYVEMGAATRSTLCAASRATSRISPSSISVSMSSASHSSSIQSCSVTLPDSYGEAGRASGDRISRSGAAQVGQVLPGVDIASLGPDRGHAAERERGDQRAHGQAVRAALGADPLRAPQRREPVDRAQRLDSPVDVLQHSAVVRRLPLDGPDQPGERPRIDLGHVDREDLDEVGLAGEAVQRGEQARRRTTARRILDRPGDGAARGHLLADDDHLCRGRRRGEGALEQGHACDLECGLVDAVHACSGAAGEDDGAQPQGFGHRGSIGSVSIALALVQVASSLEPAANRARLGELVGQDADLVVLPEAFARDFGRPGSDVGPYAEPVDGPFVTALVAAAGDRTVVAGMFETSPDPARPFNTLVVVDGSGVVASYRKIHLYDSFGYRESKALSAGDLDQRPVF